MKILKGQRKRILRRFSNSITVDYHFTARPVHTQDTVSGTVEICGSNWVFPKETKKLNLKPENVAGKGTWDTFYSVYVTPDCDIEVTHEKSQTTNLSLLLLLSGVIIIAAIAITFLSNG